MIVDYDNPGEGGFYDNLGTYNHAPNIVFGYPYDHGQPYVGEMLSELFCDYSPYIAEHRDKLLDLSVSFRFHRRNKICF